MGSTECIPARQRSQDDLYRDAAATFGAAIERFSRGYEADPDRRRDLLQDIHLALWRSFEGFNARCSLRTWVYRVAHSVATSHVIRQRRTNTALVGLEEIESLPDGGAGESAADERQTLDRLLALIHRLKPLDRQVILAYLEGMDAASIGETAGILRNAIEYVALTVVVAFMGFLIWTFHDPLMRTGAALSVAAGLYMGHQLYKRLGHDGAGGPRLDDLARFPPAGA
jgi:RNA polymerase sigma-70 factor (ECF subfamily)